MSAAVVSVLPIIDLAAAAATTVPELLSSYSNTGQLAVTARGHLTLQLRDR